jgi:L-iditol 2-dehydrogenase
MKAAVNTGIGQISLQEVPTPKPGPTDALVRIKAAGVCGTDIKTYRRGHPAFKPPVVLGHEFAGVVEETGSAVDWLSPGDRVAVAPYLNCGKCYYCRHGHGELCENRSFLKSGAFAEFVLVPEDIARRGAFQVPEGLSFAEAALAEPLACCLRALTLLDLRGDSSLVVVGAGFMGVLNAMAAKAAYGLESIVIAEVDRERREAAGKFSLSAIDPAAEEFKDRLDALTEGRGADAVIVAVGAAEVFGRSLTYVRKGGVVHVFGGLPSSVTLNVPAYLVHYNGVAILGSSGFAADDWALAGKLLADGRVVVKDLIGATFSLAETEQAILGTGGPVLKTVVTP